MTLAPLRYDPPTQPRLVIIHEDRDMIVLNKPGGLLSVPGRTPELLDSALTRVRETHPGAQAVHRLDLGTSGVLVVATRRKADRRPRYGATARPSQAMALPRTAQSSTMLCASASMSIRRGASLSCRPRR